MKQHAELQAWLPTARSVEIMELMQVVAVDGAAYRYTDGTDLNHDGFAWSGTALQWSRSTLTYSKGIEVSDCTITIVGGSDDRIGGQPVGAALRAGIWDGATITLLRAYFDASGMLRGVLKRFEGVLGSIKLSAGVVDVTVKGKGTVFNRSVPAVYQSGCQNTLFDTGCGLSRAAWQVSGTVAADSTAKTVMTTRTEDADWFTAGVIQFTSGDLLGLRRTVRQHLAGGAISLFEALPVVPEEGTTYVMTPGCNRTTGAGGCAKFSNIIMFRGTPYIPEPEATV